MGTLRPLSILWLSFPLMSFAAVDPVTIVPSNPGEVAIAWNGEKLRPYQVETSSDLLTWLTFPTILVPESDGPAGLLVEPGPPTPEAHFYRVREGAIRPGFDTHPDSPLIQGDDLNVSEQVDIGFDVNFAGQLWDQCWVNNNGNITFDDSIGYGEYQTLALLDPASVTAGLKPIIAAFWGDVDTHGTPPGFTEAVVVTFGQGTVDGAPAFGVNWVDVGYYKQKYDKLNSFQLILIDRSASGSSGDFDIEFNYNQIQWEAGKATSAPNGYGGSHPPRVGFSNTNNLALEVDGSRQSLEFLDTIVTYAAGTGYTDTEAPNYPTPGNPGTGGLKFRTDASDVPGRFVYRIRNGKLYYLDSIFEANIGSPTAESFPNWVTVDGSGSTIPTGAQALYMWSVPPDTTTALVGQDNPLTPEASVYVQPGTSMTFTLIVRIEHGGMVATATDTVLIDNQ